MAKSNTDQFLDHNKLYANGHAVHRPSHPGKQPIQPARRVAVVGCMDARLDIEDLLGLQTGEAHVIRNAGGVVTADEIRSLAISQRLLGTKEIILIHHTDCGMLTFTDDGFKKSIQDELGVKPEWAAEAFDNLEVDVRQSIARIKQSPYIPHTNQVRGFVFDVATGLLNEVK
jgi:carbonic anhydrase